jgi:hypothetical protein
MKRFLPITVAGVAVLTTAWGVLGPSAFAQRRDREERRGSPPAQSREEGRNERQTFGQEKQHQQHQRDQNQRAAEGRRQEDIQQPNQPAQQPAPAQQAQPGGRAQQRDQAQQQQQNNARQRFNQQPGQPGATPLPLNQNADHAARQEQQRANQQQRQEGQPNQQRGMAEQRRGNDQQLEFGKLGFDAQSQQNRLAVSKMQPNSAAARIGLREGDQIVSIGGQNVANQQQFNLAMQQQFNRHGRYRDARIPIIVYRNGNPYTLYWTWPALAIAGYGPFAPGYRGGYYTSDTPYTTGYRGAPAQSGAFLGVDLDQRVRNAAVVTRIVPGSPAEQAGLAEGDVIWTINGESINSPQEVSYLIGQMQPGQSAAIGFGRPGQAQAVLAQRGEVQGAVVPEQGTPPLSPSGTVEGSVDVQTPATPPAPSEAVPSAEQPQPQTEPPQNPTP